MTFWNSLSGQCRIEIVSGDLSQMLSAVTLNGLSLQNVEFLDELHLQATVDRKQLMALEQLVSKRGDTLYVRSKLGIFWSVINIWRRPILVFGLLFVIVLCQFLSSRILFVEVSGNNKIPDHYIIETAKNCGLDLLASRRDLRSEKIKNALLSQIPQLQWAGVNTRGCVASITVRERDEPSNRQNISKANSIVAGRDGIIQEITVLSGTPLCKVGQGVKAGDVLVSGYTDCGLVIKLQQADAEVFAYTFRDLQAVMPVKVLKRTSQNKQYRRIMLRIGKNIINLWKDSGISDTRCVKMYSEKFLTLPGGFQLPIVLVTEYCYKYQILEDALEQPSWIEAEAEKYLLANMVAGNILDGAGTLTHNDNLFVFKGKYTCLEMIGQKRYEENLIKNGT